VIETDLDGVGADDLGGRLAVLSRVALLVGVSVRHVRIPCAPMSTVEGAVSLDRSPDQYDVEGKVPTILQFSRKNFV
jgi:hypothetical protein